MKARHIEAERVNAWAILQSIKASVGQEFHTLSSSQVDALLVAADAARYQRPKNANGSRARYFYSLLQRRAS